MIAYSVDLIKVLIVLAIIVCILFIVGRGWRR